MRRVLIVLAGFLLAPVLCGFEVFTGSGWIDTYHLNYSGAPDPAGATMAITFERPVAGTYAAEVGGQVFTVNGSSTRVTDGTWPATLAGAQGHAWIFDGAIDLTSTIAPPAGDFSAFCVLSQDSITGGMAVAVGNITMAINLVGWAILPDHADVIFAISSDGAMGSATMITDTAALVANRPAFIAVSYDWISSGASKMRLYVDERTAVTSDVAAGPVYANSSDLSIGADGAGIGALLGRLGHCAYWDGVVKTAAEFTDLRRQYRGMMSSSGNLVEVVSATPPAIVVCPRGTCEPYLVDLPPNTGRVGSPASGSGGVYGPRATDNLAQRGSVESWAAGSPTGWIETSGGGTSDATEDNTNLAHGGSAASMLCDRTNSISLDSACKTISASTAYYGLAELMTAAGTATAYVQFIEFTSADCTTGATTTTLWTGDPGATWTRKGDTRTTGVGVQSGRLRLLLDTTSATVIADGAMLYAGSTPVDHGCFTDADSTAVCTTSVTSIKQPLPANGNWTFTATVRSPVSWVTSSPIRYAAYVPGTAGNNNKIEVYWGNNTLLCKVYNSGGVATSSTVAAAGLADTDYEIKMTHSSGGELVCCFEGTCDATPGTGAIMDDINATLYLAGTNAAGTNVHVEKPRFTRGLR